MIKFFKIGPKSSIFCWFYLISTVLCNALQPFLFNCIDKGASRQIGGRLKYDHTSRAAPKWAKDNPEKAKRMKEKASAAVLGVCESLWILWILDREAVTHLSENALREERQVQEKSGREAHSRNQTAPSVESNLKALFSVAIRVDYNVS